MADSLSCFAVGRCKLCAGWVDPSGTIPRNNFASQIFSVDFGIEQDRGERLARSQTDDVVGMSELPMAKLKRIA